MYEHTTFKSSFIQFFVESCKVNIECVFVIEQCSLLFYDQNIFDQHLVQFHKKHTL